MLHAAGLVRLTPRRGSWVAGELTAQDLDEIFPLMALLEGLCASEAVRKATPAGVKRLEALHLRLERHAAAGDVARYYEENYLFHEAVQELAANPWPAGCGPPSPSTAGSCARSGAATPTRRSG